MNAITRVVVTNPTPSVTAVAGGMSVRVAARGVRVVLAGVTGPSGAGSSGLSVGKTLYVDSVNGSDGTGTRGDASKPYLTLAAAKTAASSGDVIHVGPGAYICAASLAKAGVNWYFEPGTTVTYTEDSATGIWDDGGAAMTFDVLGDADFYRLDSDGETAKRVIVCSHASSVIRINCRDIFAGDPGLGGNGEDECIRQEDGSLTVICRDVYAYGGTGSSIWWENGFLTVRGRKADGQQAAFYSIPVGTPTGDAHIQFEELYGAQYAVYENGSETTAACWIRANTVRAPINPAVYLLGSSRVYVECQKILGGVNNSGNGLLYIRADKVSAVASFPMLFSAAAGTATNYIQVNQWDGALVTTSAANSIGEAFKFSAGTSVFFGGEYTGVSGSNGVNVTGGTVRLHGMRFDTSANASGNPITVAVNTLTLDNCTLVAQSAANGITAGSAKSVAIGGTLTTNRPNHANVTLTGGAMVRSDTGTITPNATIAGNISGSAATATLAATATALATGRTIAMTGDVTWTTAAFDGTANVTAAGTLATVVSAGTTGGSTAIPVITINAKGLTTGISTAAVVAPAGTLSGATLASNVTASSLLSASGGAFGTAAFTASSAYMAIGGGTFSGPVIFPASGIRLIDANGFYLAFASASTTILSTNRTLTLDVYDANRTITLQGDLTVSGAATVSGTNTGNQTITLTGDVTGSGTGSFATTLATNKKTKTISAVLFAASDKVFVRCGFTGTITRATISGFTSAGASVSGSAVVDIWKDTTANYPPTVADTITASAKPTLTATATPSTDTTLTGWTTAITAGDWLVFNLDSVTTLGMVRVDLEAVVT